MTSPIRPSRNATRRRSLAELNAEIDALLGGVELDEPVQSAPPPRRSLLDGFTPPKVSVASDAIDRMGTNDPRRRATFDYTNAPNASTLLERGRESQQQSGEIRRALESTGRVGRAVSGAIGGTQEFVPNAIAGAGSSATGIAAGALRLPGRAARAVTGSPRETNEADQSVLDRTANTLERVSRGISDMVPIRSGAGVAGRMIGGAAPYMIPGAAGARFGMELLAGGALTALESIGNSASSATQALGDWEKLRRENKESESWFDPALRAAGRIAKNETARPLVDGAIDMTLGAAPRGIKRIGEQIDRIRPRAVAPTLDATRPRYALGGDGGTQSDIAEPDLDAWRETTFGSATFGDPMRVAQNELDTQRAAYDAAQARARQQRQVMAARGRAAGAERALRDEQVQVDALREEIPPLPRTTPTSADADAEARRMEAWARRTYGAQDRLNTAVDSGDEGALLGELERLVSPRRKEIPLADLRTQLDPQRATPRLDEVGQQLDEAGREALDAQQAEATINPRVRAAREKLNTALDSGDDTKASRALRELAKLQDQGLYAAAPVGLAMSQGEDGEGMDGGDAAMLASLGALVATRKGKQFLDRTYSRLGRAIENTPFEKGTADQWAAALSKNVAKGEREWTGIDKLLQTAKAEGRTLTRGEIAQKFQRHDVRNFMGEGVLGGGDISRATLDEVEQAMDYVSDRMDEQDIEFSDADYYNEVRRHLSNLRWPGGRSVSDALDELTTSSRDGLEAAMETVRNWDTRRGVSKGPLAIRELDTKYEQYTQPSTPAIGKMRNYREVVVGGNFGDGYSSPHWDGEELADSSGQSAMTHVRLSDRKVNGKNSLFVEEIQDDWAQEGRRNGIRAEGDDARGLQLYKEWNDMSRETDNIVEELAVQFQERFHAAEPFEQAQIKSRRAARKMLIDAYESGTTSGGMFDELEREYVNLRKRLSEIAAERGTLFGKVADRPFLQTGEWVELAIKRVLDEAAGGDYEQVVFPTGRQVAENFNMRKQVDTIEYHEGELIGWKDGADVFREKVSEADLPKYVGEKKAKDLIDYDGVLEGEQLELGGEGHIGFYDTIVPRVLKDYEKKLGVKLDVSRNAEGNLVVAVHDALRGKINTEGQPMWAAGAVGAGAAASEDEDTRNMALGVAGMALGTSKVGRAGLAKAAKAAGDIAQRLSSESQPWSRASIELATMKDPRFNGIENLPEGEALELQIGAQRMVSEKIAKALGLKQGRDFRASPSHGLWFSEDGNAPVQPSILLEFAPGVDKTKALALVAEQSRIMKQAGMFYMDVTDDGAREAVEFVVRDGDDTVHAAQYLDLIKEGRSGWNGATVINDGGRTLIVFDEGIDDAAAVAELDRFEEVIEAAGFTVDRDTTRRIRVNAEEVGEEGYMALVDRSGVRGGNWRESVREAERLYEGVAITAEKRIAGQRIKDRPDAQSLTLNLEPESLAAVKVGRMVFTGRNHSEAFGLAQRAVKEKKLSARALTEARDNPASSGYTLDNGEFVTRFEGEAVLELMEDRGDDLASRALGKIQGREADGATSWLRSEDFKGYRAMLGPAATGAAVASLLAPSDAEAQGTGVGVGEAAGGVGGMLAVAAGSGAAALGASKLIGRSSNKIIGRVANGAERFLRETDPLTNARPGNFTSNLERVQRAAYSKPLEGPSQVNPNDWFRMDKASPDADRQRLAEAIEVVVATSGVAVQKADRLGNPVAGKPTITWDQVRSEARRLQVDPDRLIEAARQRGWSPAEALAGRTVIGDNVNVIAAIEQRLASQQLSVEESKRLAGILEQYENQTNRLLEVYATERSAAGRLLNSYKIVANQTLDPSVWTSRAFKANGGALTSQQLVDLDGFIKAKDRAGLAKFVADLHKPTAGELFSAFLKAGMLMSPKTHITNFASNALMTGMEVVKDAPAAAADKMLRTLVNAVDPDKAGARRTKDFSPVAMAKASLSGARKGAAEAAKILRGESVDNQMARWDAKGEAFVRTGNPKADAFFNIYLNAPFRALSAGDRIFRQSALERSIAEQQRVIGTQAVTDDMMLQAIADAELATFQQRTAVGEAAQSAKRGLVRGAAKGGALPEFVATAVAETTLPFVKTPAAVLSSSVEYAAGIAATPNDIARLLTEAKKGIKDPNQAAIVAALQKRAAERLGRQAVGALALTTGWVLAANGLLSAPVPLQKKKERDTGQMLGNAPSGSLQVGEETKVSVDRISPIGNLLTAGAAIFNELQDPQNPWADAVASGVFSMGAAMLDNSFLQGVQDVQRATTDEGGFGRLAENRALSAVPFNSLLRSVSRVVDPTVRDAQTLDERFLAGIPFASRSLSPKRDPLGNEITRPRGGMALLNEIVPGTLSVDRSARDPQAKLLRDLNAMLTRPARDKNKETVEEFRDREQVLGAATRRELDRLQRLPSWNQMSDEAKRDKIDARISAVRSQATQRFRRGRVTVPQEGLRPNVAGGGAGSSF